MINLVAYEHKQFPVRDADTFSLSTADVALLSAINDQRPGFCRLGHRSVTFTQFAGLVNLGDRILEILPKIARASEPATSRGTVLRLLSLAANVPVFSSGAVGHDVRHGSLLEVFLQSYLDSVAALVRRGLLRQYVTEERDIRVIRGRLRIECQLTTHGMRPDLLACRFDELVIDNPWNQVIKAALHASRPWLRSTNARRQWIELAGAFDEVTLRPNAVVLGKQFVIDRQSGYYAIALQWAKWILNLLTPNLGPGKDAAPQLLFDMNKVFEAAVAAALGARLRGPGLCLITQDTGRFLAESDGAVQENFFRLRPDLVLRSGNDVVWVGDTKWTLMQAAGSGRVIPDESHIYQLNAYASVYPCDEFALIYPMHDGLHGAVGSRFRLRGSGGRRPLVRVAFVDVTQDALPFSEESDAEFLSTIFDRHRRASFPSRDGIQGRTA